MESSGSNDFGSSEIVPKIILGGTTLGDANDLDA